MSRQNADAILKNQEPFIYGVVQDTTNVRCKNVLQQLVICLIVTNFSYYYQYVLLNMMIR